VRYGTEEKFVIATNILRYGTEEGVVIVTNIVRYASNGKQASSLVR